MNRRKLLERFSTGSVQNTTFSDLKSLVEGLGFRLSRVKGVTIFSCTPKFPSR